MTPIALALLLPLAPQGTGPRSATVEPFELTVRRPIETPGIDVFGEPGVQIKVAVHTPGRTILAVDEERTKLTSWKDDKETDLAGGVDEGFFFWAQLEAWGSERSEASVLKLATESLPAPGASRVHLEATLALMTASKSEQEVKPLVLKNGESVQIAGLELKVGDLSSEGSSVDFSLESKQPLDRLRSIAFLDAAGEEIDAESMGSGSFGFGGDVTYSRSWSLARKVDRVQLRVDYWSDLEATEVPLSLALGAGL